MAEGDIPGSADLSAAQQQVSESGARLSTQMTQLLRELVKSNTKLGQELKLDEDKIAKLNEPLTKFMQKLLKLGEGTEALKEALKDANKNLANASADLEGTAKALGKLSVDLKKDHTQGGQAEKIRATAAELKKFRDQIEGYSEEFLKKVANGGLKPSEQAALIEAIKVSAGPSANLQEIWGALEDMRRAAEKAFKEGAHDHLKLLQDYQDAVISNITAGQNVLASAEMVVTQGKEAYQAKLNQLKLEGKKIPLRMKLEKWGDAAGGKGYASEANSRLQGSQIAQKTGAAGFAGQFFGEDGKFSKAKMAMALAEGAQSRGKIGLEAYKTTGRQFGMEGQGFGSIYGNYQDTSMKLARIGRDTGHFDAAEQMKAFQGTSEAIRSGAPLEKRNADQLAATKLTLQYTNSLGVSTEKLNAVQSAVRRNLGVGPESTAASLDRVKATMEDINKDVAPDMKITAEETVDLFQKMADDIDNAGMSMKTLSKYTQESQVWAKQLGVPLKMAAELAQRFADLKSGKTSSAMGSTANAMAFGVLQKVRVGAANKIKDTGMSKAQDTGGFYDSDVINDVVGNSGEDADTKKDLLAAANSSPENRAFIRAVMNGKWGPFMAMGADAAQVARQLDRAGWSAVLGTDLKQAAQNIKQKAGNVLGDKSWQAPWVKSQTGKTGLDAIAETADINGEAGVTSGPGMTDAEARKATEKDNAAMTGLATAADPMAAFKNAVESFSGSVNRFGGMLVAQEAMDLASKADLGGKALGWGGKALKWGKGLFSGGAAAEGAAAAGEAAAAGGEAAAATTAAAEGAAATTAAAGGGTAALTGAGVAAGAATLGAVAAAAGSIYMAGNQTKKALEEGSSYSSQASIDKAWEKGNYIDWWARNGTKDIEDIGSSIGNWWDKAFGNSQKVITAAPASPTSPGVGGPGWTLNADGSMQPPPLPPIPRGVATGSVVIDAQQNNQGIRR